MGWLIIILGLVLIGIGGFFTYYGQSLLHQKPSQQSEQISAEIVSKIITPQEEKLLSLIYKYQKDFGLKKLIVNRKQGKLYFDDKEKNEKYNINLIGEVYDISSDYEKYINEFETLILNIPSDYLKHIPEMRFGSPYVIRITKEGIAYLREKR